MPSKNVPDISIFFSYAHKDEAILNFIPELKKALITFVQAKSGGKTVEIFTDRDDLGWGTNWRDAIGQALSSAMVFIPFVSANYLSSEPCRDEFMAFQAQAQRLRLEQLILPVIPLGTPMISNDSDDDIARFTESVQYKFIEAAVLGGSKSSEWLPMVADLSTSLLKAIEAAVDSASLTPVTAGQQAGSGGEVLPDGEDDDLDYFQLAEQSEIVALKLSEVGPALLEASELLSGVFDRFNNPQMKPKSLKQGQVMLMRLASDVREPAADLEHVGSELKEAIKEMDFIVRSTVDLSNATGDAPFIMKTRQELRKLVDEVAGLHDINVSMTDALDAVRPLEVLSTPLRKALRPVRGGIAAIGDGFRMAEAWSELLDDDGDEV